MEKYVCDKIIDNISKRYYVVSRDWFPDGMCSVKIELPDYTKVKLNFNVVDNSLYVDMFVQRPFQEKLRMSYFSKDYNIYIAEVYTSREGFNLLYNFVVGVKFDPVKDKDFIMQGRFIDEMLRNLNIE